jgi:hypothetical protein
MVWLKSDWRNMHKYLFNTYDGWHSFKGGMLLSNAGIIYILSDWQHAFLYLALYFLIFEGLFGKLLLSKEKKNGGCF